MTILKGKQTIKRKKKIVPEEVIIKGLEDYQGGMTYREVAKKWGVYPNAVFYWVRMSGLPSRSKTSWKRIRAHFEQKK